MAGLVPAGLEELMERFTLAVLESQPEVLEQFAARFFAQEWEDKRAQLAASGPRGEELRQEGPSNGDAAAMDVAVAGQPPAPTAAHAVLPTTKTAAKAAAEGDNNDDDDDDIVEDEHWFPPSYPRGKRKSVCGESFDPRTFVNAPAVVHPKTDQEAVMLQEVVQRLFLFQSLDAVELKVVIDAMQQRETRDRDEVIRQGDSGDNFYVVERGVFEVFVHGSLVVTYDNKGSFGELALMYNCPRAASVISVGPGVLWALDRVTFRKILLAHAMEKRSLYSGFLRQTPLLQHLSDEEREKLVDALEPVFFEDGIRIIHQGEPAQDFFFVVSGSARVTISTAATSSELEVTTLQAGAFFGELALITNKPRAANVYAHGSVTCARLSRKAFERLLGPCIAAMKSRIPGYEKRLEELLGPKEGGETHLGLEARP